ncbi:MAG: hypothetical protein QM669_01945 [Siphonobacter sp.]
MNTYAMNESRNPFLIKTLQIFSLLTFLVTLFVNWTAVALPLNGKSTQQLSDQYPNLFTPAGLTFSIWGVIYALLMGYTIFQVRGVFSRRESAYVERVVKSLGSWFIFSNLLNACWIIAWHYEWVGISVIIMLALLNTQLLLLWKAYEVSSVDTTWGERFVVRIPFGIYAGWISIATIANITAFLVKIGWNQWGLSAEFWAIAMIVVGTILTQAVLFTRRSVAYGLVVVWAIMGIVIKRYQAPEPAMDVVYAAEICLLVLAITIILVAFTSVFIPVHHRPALRWTQPKV